MFADDLYFLSQHATLQSMYDYIESEENGFTLRQKSNLYGRPLPAYRLIIKKLLNIGDFQTYANEVITYYSTENPTKGAFYRDLKDYLDTL